MDQEQNNWNQTNYNYNLQNNNETQNSQSLDINQSNNIQQPTTKKKLKWWIPLSLFLSGFLMAFCSKIAENILRSQGTITLDYEVYRHFSIMIFRWIAVICWVLVIPTLIFVMVKYFSKKSK